MSNDNAKMGQGLDIDVPYVGIVGKVRVSHTQFMFFCFLTNQGCNIRFACPM